MLKEILVLFNKAEDEDKEFIIDFCDSFSDYVNVLTKEFTRVKLRSFMLSGEERSELIAKYDRERRIIHESAFSSCNALNRLCKMYDLPLIFSQEEFIPKVAEDREKVSDICKQFVDEAYMANSYRNVSFDDFIEEVASLNINFPDSKGVIACA